MKKKSKIIILSLKIVHATLFPLFIFVAVFLCVPYKRIDEMFTLEISTDRTED